LRTPRDRAPRTLEGNEVGRRFYERRGRSLTDETRIVPYRRTRSTSSTRCRSNRP